MDGLTLDPRLAAELKERIDKAYAVGELTLPLQIDQQLDVFRERFGPTVLKGLSGEPLLQLLHGRGNSEARSLSYWLEFKNDEEFRGGQFGKIGGGSALKFGIFFRQNDGAWVTGSAKDQKILMVEEAIELAVRQRDELLAGVQVLAQMGVNNVSDETYRKLQNDMAAAAPQLVNAVWAHKYWFLLFPDRLDDYHSPRYQRFHLFKLIQMPPDQGGILDGNLPRFICAGRFIAAARELSVPVTNLNMILNRRDGALHRYWKIGTTEGSAGQSHWEEMRDGGFVSIGSLVQLQDLALVIRQEKAEAKEQIKSWLIGADTPPDSISSGASGTATRKAGEILNFAQEIAEGDIVLACEGQNIKGIGRIIGPYQYDQTREFRHQRPVEWLALEPWVLPEAEGPRTTVYELGKKAKNLLAIETQLLEQTPVPVARRKPVSALVEPAPLSILDPLAARVDGILRRKGQVVFYGPPGTGKTYRALNIANELAARQAFRKTFVELTEGEKQSVSGPNGLIRVCTFHPGWSYEDFVEGLKPKTSNGQMLFEPKDGIFKRLCADADKAVDKNYFLVIDEMNRGDLPRIFGELITTLEYDKRGQTITLPITGLPFSIPRNVFIIGSMNTADRSISIMDTALRRRFGFVELMPDSTVLGGRSVGGLRLGAWLDALNTRLRKHMKRDARNLQIGHAYLLPSQPITSIAEFSRVLRDDIIPLLEEYCYEDFVLLAKILGDQLVDCEMARIHDELFLPNREEDLIQAISFEEMQPLIVDQEPADNDLAGQESSDAFEDEDNDAKSSNE